jgi:hypothetical protein
LSVVENAAAAADATATAVAMAVVLFLPALLLLVIAVAIGSVAVAVGGAMIDRYLSGLGLGKRVGTCTNECVGGGEKKERRRRFNLNPMVVVGRRRVPRTSEASLWSRKAHVDENPES